MRSRSFSAALPALLLSLSVSFAPRAQAQDRLRTMPGYEQYARVARDIPGSVKMGALAVTWAPDGKSFDYMLDGKRWRYDVATKRASEASGSGAAANGARGRGVERGRQAAFTLTADSSRKAFYRDRNLYISDASGANEVALTTDGSEAKRIKYGTASWVYGEELRQTTAMWWNPSSPLAYMSR